MGSFGGKSLVLRPVDRPTDDRGGHLISSAGGARRKRGRGSDSVATAFEEAEYGRAAARHRCVAGAFSTQRTNEARDLRVMSRDGRLKIVDQQLF